MNEERKAKRKDVWKKGLERTEQHGRQNEGHTEGRERTNSGWKSSDYYERRAKRRGGNKRHNEKTDRVKVTRQKLKWTISVED